MIRRYRPEDAQACRSVFVMAVRIGAAGRYSAEERSDWVKDPAMPDGWADWPHTHITDVAEGDDALDGFFMLERSGYLNMAFVRPQAMGTGLADALYGAILAEAHDLGLPGLHVLAGLPVLASRCAQSFVRRHGWRMAPELTGLDGLDPEQGPHAPPEQSHGGGVVKAVTL